MQPLEYKSNKIFNIGFKKSGSTSLTRAMEILGFKSAHFLHGKDRLIDIIDKNRLDGKDFLYRIDNYDFYSDFKGEDFYQELDVKYPNSKFILTVRDLDSWLESMWRHTRRNQFRPCYKWDFNKVEPEKWMEKREKVISETRNYFQGRERDFLKIDIIGGEKWEKLCDFLDLPVPQEEFPHLNKASERSFQWLVDLF